MLNITRVQTYVRSLYCTEIVRPHDATNGETSHYEFKVNKLYSYICFLEIQMQFLILCTLVVKYIIVAILCTKSCSCMQIWHAYFSTYFRKLANVQKYDLYEETYVIINFRIFVWF